MVDNNIIIDRLIQDDSLLTRMYYVYQNWSKTAGQDFSNHFENHIAKSAKNVWLYACLSLTVLKKFTLYTIASFTSPQ